MIAPLRRAARAEIDRDFLEVPIYLDATRLIERYEALTDRYKWCIDCIVSSQ